MNTYQGDEENKKDMGTVSSIQTDEDIMLAGGFESFSTPQSNSDQFSLGNADYSYMNQKYNTNSYAYKPVLTRMQQITHAFNPFGYDCYNNMTIDQGKGFANWFSRIYVGVAYLGILFLTIANPYILLLTSSNPYMPVEYFQNAQVIVFETIICLILAAIAPIWYRINAWLLRLIGRLACLISRKNISDKNIYLVSIYALVPYMILRLVPFFCPLIVPYIILQTVLPIIGLIMAIVYMCIGVATVE